MAMHQLGRHGLQGFRLNGELGQIDQVHAELLGQDGQNFLFLDVTAIDENRVQRLVGSSLLRFFHGCYIGVLKKALLNQNLQQIH
jgi:hypothetical protein